MPAARDRFQAELVAKTSRGGIEIVDGIDDVIDADASSSPIAGEAYAPARMALQRMDNVLIVVEDLEAAKAFFAELGMELEGETQVEGPWVDQTVGLDGVRADIAMMRTPDGHSRVELSRFHTPPAVRAEPENAPSNALGIRRIMFAVDDVDDVVDRLRSGHGAELVGEIAQYGDMYRLCFLRGPEGIVIGLAEQLG
jgi:catechol 2,3-dioxygenase-like lactoylglutathione lyase family enzyme